MEFTKLQIIAIFLIIASVALILYFTMKKENMEEVETPKVEAPKVEPVATEPEATMAPSTPAPETKGEITPSDLLPVQADVQNFEKQFPAGEGEAKDKNYLIAGYNIGINTVGSSLKNANQQLRSDPYIPRQSVLWNDSSIMSSDLTNRKVLEIGSSS
jgi:hypothetical protein